MAQILFSLLSYLGLVQLLCCFVYVNARNLFQGEQTLEEPPYTPLISPETVQTVLQQVVQQVNLSAQFAYKVVRCESNLLTLKVRYPADSPG